MLDRIEKIKEQLISEIKNCNNLREIQDLKVKYLARKGIISELFNLLKNYDSSERPTYGKELNLLKTYAEELIESRIHELSRKERDKQLEKEKIDITLPGLMPPQAKGHILINTILDIIDIFSRMGFQYFEFPEVETDYYNFDSLNSPPDHPSRDMHDTFYTSDGAVLRSHTTPFQVRVMTKCSPPIKAMTSGKCYRRDRPDASHSPMFHQIDAIHIDKSVSFADLKGTLNLFAQQFFGKNVKTRFRPSFFPFTTPSAEMDISCFICGGKGCSVCKHKGWLEILGCGMIHPQVFRNANMDPAGIQGWAFGMGVDRITMLKYRINDIRLFFTNEMAFLKQF